MRPNGMSQQIGAVQTCGNTQHKVSCNDCSLNPVCLPLAVDKGQLEKLDKLINRRRPMKRGEHVYFANDTFHSIFAIRSGSIKTYSLTEDGEEQVTGFYLPGEIIGIDGINTNRHINSAKALESTALCEIPFEQMELLSVEIPSLQHHFFKLMSKEIQADQQLQLLLSKKPADERIAALLVNFGARHKQRGLSATQYRLPMSRNDIGNYLGLAVETVSRVFTRFQNEKLIQAEGKEIIICDWDELCKKTA